MQIEISSVSKTLGTLHTLDNISLHVGEEEFVVILGPSGCGKSTLFNIIAGLITPDSGRVLINGKDLTGKTGKISYMQQKDLLLPSRRLLDNVSVPLLLKGLNKQAARSQAREYLPVFGLEEFSDHYPRQLSVGMRQRAALLRTFLFSREFLLLDEPFASLDAITRRKMHLWLKEIQQLFHSAILFITHDIDEALLLADRIYVFSERPAHVKREIKLTPEADNKAVKAEILALLG
ncbi:MAG TPA: ABC transporter ATP-binding protein [Syntrophomonadaceae bacterium]|jgi:ABC-type nitrate/sulfonate/bicarbonate transport system ATPase subunit|nr:ABC transporter ATP-binding protein [Syntrophomonadaceae bacterium]HRX20116.1 ABC transporter ATP-binding protein [Syntrophomonadaceae bacterium]